MNPVSRRTDLNLLQLRRARPFQPLRLLRQKSHLQSGAQPNHHASRPPVVPRRNRSRHFRPQFLRPLIRPLELLLKSHESLSIPGRDTRPPPAPPPRSAASPAAKIQNSPQSPPAHPGNSIETSPHNHAPQRAHAPGGDRSYKSERPAPETPEPPA